MKFRLRYGLRTAGVIVTVACFVLAYVANERREYRNQHRTELDALERIERGGGAAFYFPPQAKLVASSGWQSRLRGERHLANISGVYLGTKCDHDVFAALGNLCGLDIRIAFLDGVNVPAEVLWSSVISLPKLDIVRISQSTVDGQLSGHVEMPKTVRHVRMDDSTAHKSVLIAISAIPNLQCLGLEGMAIDDEVFPNISRNRRIVALRFSRSNVTDENVLQIAGMDMLEQLDLSHTACSDAIIDRLLLMPHLKSVNTDGSQITEQGMQRLTDSGIETGVFVEELKTEGRAGCGTTDRSRAAE